LQSSLAKLKQIDCSEVQWTSAKSSSLPAAIAVVIAVWTGPLLLRHHPHEDGSIDVAGECLTGLDIFVPLFDESLNSFQCILRVIAHTAGIGEFHQKMCFHKYVLIVEMCAQSIAQCGN
jgi:hypothetical protein